MSEYSIEKVMQFNGIEKYRKKPTASLADVVFELGKCIEELEELKEFVSIVSDYIYAPKNKKFGDFSCNIIFTQDFMHFDKKMQKQFELVIKIANKYQTKKVVEKYANI